MEVCLMIEGQEGVGWEQWRALGEAAQSNGFAALFRSDHYLPIETDRSNGSLDAWGTICALAATTSEIRLGTLVSPATFRHPSVLAKLAVTADHISGGRIDVGIGAGWYEAEHAAYGFEFASTRTRIDVFAEQLELVRRSWEPGPLEFDGSHYRVRRLDAEPKPLQRPRPPLIVGGSGGGRSVALAARWADEYNTPFPSEEQIRARRAAVLEAWERAGRDPASARFSVMTGCLVGADRAELERRAARLARRRGQDCSDPADCVARLPETWLVGTVEQVAERLRAVARLGVDRVMLQHLLHDDLDALELIGRELIPAAGA